MTFQQVFAKNWSKIRNFTLTLYHTIQTFNEPEKESFETMGE